MSCIIECIFVYLGMKIALIIMAVAVSNTGGYHYACRDLSGKTYRLMMFEEKTVGDTVYFNDSMMRR